MVLTNPELVASLQNEVRILLHLAGKVDRAKLDYRPTPNQRSTLELLQYLTMMGPELLKGIKAARFDSASWTAAEKAAANRDYDHAIAAIGEQAEFFPRLLADVSDADLREEIDMFGSKSSRGAVIVNIVLCGYAAYRTQLFLYLKSCGRTELSTWNLWAGMDAPAPA